MVVNETIAAASSPPSSKVRQRQRQRQRRRLWLTREEQELSMKTGRHQPFNTTSSCGDVGSRNGGAGDNDDDENDDDELILSYDRVFDEFSILPPRKSLSFFLGNTIVVGQEFVLTGLFLAGHRAAIQEEERWDEQQQQQQLKNYDGDGSSSNSNSNNYGPSVILLSDKLIWSLGLVWLTIVISVITNKFATSKQYRIQHRFTDFALMAMFIRLLASVLRTLTSSFSSDTVYALSILSLFIHILACDYAYANGVVVSSQDDDEDENENAKIGIHVDDNEDDNQGGNQSTETTTVQKSTRRKHRKYQRPAFKGGTLSLTTAFFATILLASRLRHNMTVYVFVCSSVVLFALFPAARHLVAVKAQYSEDAIAKDDRQNHQLSSSSSSLWKRISSYLVQSVPLMITTILSIALMLLLDEQERRRVSTMLIIICVVVPIWKFYLQRFKVLLRGPWDIAHV